MKVHLLALSFSLSLAAPLTRYNTPSGDGAACGGDEIVGKYVSILQHKSYNGNSYQDTANELISPDYQDFSDSIHSLLDEKLDETPLSRNRTQFLQNVEELQNENPPPFRGFDVTNVLCAENDVVYFSWTLPHVGSGKYRVKGMQLLYLDENRQICRAEFEVNSLAWGADTGQIEPYCEQN